MIDKILNMNELDKSIFITLFREACQKAFGFPLSSPLTETDSKLLSNKILESTGLVIGAKSIKNYSFFILNSKSKEARKENPSAATLDTLARYVLDAPYTDELKRKENESHYPYWFQYRNRFSDNMPRRYVFRWSRKLTVMICVIVLSAPLGFFLINYFAQNTDKQIFKDNFDSVDADSLRSKGWIVRSEDNVWWNRRNEKPGHLALYTLKGDNWSNSENRATIKNLLMRKINSDCFMVEIHLTGFIPMQNWQQAGILLSEDSAFNGKMLRLSISYNDFFGGYKKPPEVIIQAISSLESGTQSKPEEIGHLTLFSIEPGNEDLVKSNLAVSALKIEKKGKHFRFLYLTGPTEGFAFREAVSGDFDFKPRYVSIFSISGWADNANQIPAYFDSFESVGIPCAK